jgi:hypothetical protein
LFATPFGFVGFPSGSLGFGLSDPRYCLSANACFAGFRDNCAGLRSRQTVKVGLL